MNNDWQRRRYEIYSFGHPGASSVSASIKSLMYFSVSLKNYDLVRLSVKEQVALEINNE